MATPITWRNVNSDSNAAANELLAQAGQTLTNALGSFGKVATGLQQDQVGRQEDLVKKNTNDFLNTVSKYTSPEELQRAQAEGVFRNMLAGYGEDIDQAAVRNAAEERMAVLQQQTLNGIKVGDAQYQQWAQPIIDAHDLAVAENRDADAAAIRQNNPGLKSLGSMAASHNKQNIFEEDQARKKELESRADEQSAWTKKNQEIIYETNQLQLDNAKSTKADRDSLTAANTELTEGINRYLASNKTFLTEAQKRAGELGYGTDLDSLTPEQANELSRKLASPEHPNETAFVNDLVSTLSKKYPKIPQEQLYKAAGGLITSATTPTAADKQAQEKRMAALDAEYGKNPFVADSLATPEDLTTALKGKGEFLQKDATDKEKDMIIRQLYDAVTNGYVASEDGKRIPITKSMLNAAVEGTEAGWFEISQMPKEVLEKMFTDNKVGDSYQEYLQYKDLKKSLEYSANTNPAALLQNLLKKADQYQKKNLKM